MGIQVQTLYREASASGASTSHNHGNVSLDFGEVTSIIDRQFISFSFQPIDEEEPRNIEDFNLIVVSNNDTGLSRNLFTGSQDITKEYVGVDGQQWYGTTFSANTIELKLGTDGIDEKELTDFVDWFKPGREGWLIMSEHQNRKILARVMGQPSIEMTPYGKEVEVTIASEKFTTSVTEYRGFINLTFVMDYPFWQAINTYFDLSELKNLGDKQKKVLLKTIYEDRIPTVQQFQSLSKIKFSGQDGFYVSKENENISTVGFAKVGYAYVGETQYNHELTENINLKKDDKFYLFYAGTAPSYPKFEFKISASFYKNYFSAIGNHFISSSDSYIRLGANKLRFTIPGFIACYNDSIKILLSHKSNIENGYAVSFDTLYTDIRENIIDTYMAPIAIKGIINARNANGGDSALSVTTTIIDQAIINIKNAMPKEYSFSINCKNGECTVSFVIDNLTIKQNCGDMIKSKFVNINKRSEIKDGYIDVNSLIEVETSIAMNDFKIDYDYMYL